MEAAKIVVAAGGVVPISGTTAPAVNRNKDELICFVHDLLCCLVVVFAWVHLGVSLGDSRQEFVELLRMQPSQCCQVLQFEQHRLVGCRL